MKHLSHIIERLVPLGFCSLIFFYYLTNKLVFFVNPIYEYLIVGSATFLLATVFITEDTHTHKHDSAFSKYSQVYILLSIIIFSFLYQPKPLSSSLALSRGLSQNLSGFQVTAPLQFSKNSEDRTLVEWIQMLNINPEPDDYIGDKVHFNGFVIHDDMLNDNQFYIGRFILACCAADARTIVLPVHYNENSISLPSDTWIDMKGTIIEKNENGERKIAIQMESYEEIPVPNNPYVY
jgi:uncharacterized repeat protein (TIGR03943 family)